MEQSTTGQRADVEEQPEVAAKDAEQPAEPAFRGQIAIIGAGSIGESLLAGLVASGIDPKRITATNRTAERGQELAERYGVQVTDDNNGAVSEADVVFLCVKPYQILELLDEVSTDIAEADTQPVLVSMAAGICLHAMEEAVSSAGAPIVRVMPNTPMLVGKGVLAAAFGRFVDDEQRAQIAELLSAAGTFVEVEEHQLDAVTALSGSGPAYFFLLAEALVDAGVSLGLSRDLATQLASATAAGAGAMLEETPDPAALRAGVSSPAGTTVAAIRELEESGLRGALYRATEACAERSAEMGRK
ncbi:pyrroline-5-carboxylate reductase [Corynebacterium sp. HMSC074A01]|uniref:pyrroline-5-carboxylate reductase n=1 Tax=Corynebacterium sp. HMSC074A01 TaxID=1715030 RepID=UPI0009F5C681|nr:pyrroline-5-carboxylate reductase [Corynebacterium sp. HMSC074A01]